LQLWKVTFPHSGLSEFEKNQKTIHPNPKGILYPNFD
jgi:hypothetical protein